MGLGGLLWFGDNISMDKGYQKFIKTIYVIGVIVTFPISVPYILWKKKQYKNKKK